MKYKIKPRPENWCKDSRYRKRNRKLESYGLSKIIKHPQGWHYQVIYLCNHRKLDNSLMIWAGWPKEYGYEEIPIK